jgi:hypothetical protein
MPFKLLIINNLTRLGGGVEFEVSIEVLQVIEIKKFIRVRFLRGGAFSEVSLTDLGQSRATRSEFSKVYCRSKCQSQYRVREADMWGLIYAEASRTCTDTG